jgi:large conductance mechanosensitive channel
MAQIVSRQTRSRAINSVSSIVKDLQSFILQGNVVDLATAVIMGAAFGGVINALVEHVITPIILNPALQIVGTDEIAGLSFNGIKYGLFLSAVINLLMVGFILFVIVRIFEKMKRKQEAEAAAEPTIEEKLNETLSRLADKL